MEVPLNPDAPLDPSAPDQIPAACWVGPRHLAGDDGRLYDTVADTLTTLGWTGLTMVRGRQEPDEASEDRQVLRSTVLHLSPDTLRWAQWTLADEPFLLGDLPIAWHVCARTDTNSPLAQWSAYFTPDVPGEVIADFLVALDARRYPVAPSGGRELVLEAVAGHGWLLDIDQTHAGAMDATFTTHLSYGTVPPLIQDGDPQALTRDVGGELDGWQAWSEPVLGGRCLWAASFSSSVPHDLVAAFARSVSSTAPVLRRVLPDSTRDRLLRAPAI
ncbi:DUF317 domain-containing protein [Streptomyces achromogenes]|uniref:DUF317 domain-containing protein n=1 Tax=Streptomyces achromogenes TaxID=67255 RepID=UPI00367BEF7C